MKKKRYFGRGAMFLLCAVFAVLFLLPTVLTITNSFMSEAEINANYGMIFSTTTGGYVSKTVNLKFIPDKVTLSQYVTGLINLPGGGGRRGGLQLHPLAGQNQKRHLLLLCDSDADALSGDPGAQLPGQ